MVLRPLRLRIEPRALLQHEPQIVSDFRLNVSFGQDPLCTPVDSASVGAAIDIGTTTVTVLLADLRSGSVLATASALNKQSVWGDDVLTRINLCATDPSAVRRLQSAIIDETIRPLLKQASGGAGINIDQIRCATVAGNTTMLHLFAGIDPAPMGIAPFTPKFLDRLQLEPALLSEFPSLQSIHLLPGCSAYVGADLTAGMLATGMVYNDGPELLVDIGTNGEIILKHHDTLLGCATAAGPAFEGAGLSSGIRAVCGAIHRVKLQSHPFEIQFETIGAATPIGICGSAYIDLLAEARRTALLNAAGRFAHPASEVLIPWQEHGKALRLSSSPDHPPIVLSELDIARILQAKAAIAAGISVLLKRAELSPRDIKTVYLAGGFGMHVNIGNAIRCGLLPGLDSSQVQAVGNTSLGGAYIALLDRGVLHEMDQIRQKLSLVELNQDPDFESCYIDHLLLP
jgi:uncharacterized 2Fe-2S/4Fe-4S cluster protein (DUF4445 family)